MAYNTVYPVSSLRMENQTYERIRKLKEDLGLNYNITFDFLLRLGLKKLETYLISNKTSLNNVNLFELSKKFGI